MIKQLSILPVIVEFLHSARHCSVVVGFTYAQMKDPGSGLRKY